VLPAELFAACRDLHGKCLRALRGAKLFDGFEDFRGVALGWRLVPDSGDAAVRSDQKRGAHDSQERFAQELLHPPRAIGFDGFEFRVTQQRKIQIVLGGELSLSFHCVAATAQDDGA
jgi:hypothetical protein